MKIALTGASGFIGSLASVQLAQLGEVHALGRRPVRGAGVQYYECDLFDEEQVASILARIKASHLVHLAWYTRPADFWTSNQNALWLERSVHLVQTFLEHGGRHVIAAGSCAEYSWDGTPCREDSTPLDDATLYAASKNALHATCVGLCARAGARLAWARVFYVYGAREAPQRFLSSASQTLRRGETIVLREPHRRLDYVHVDDVSRAFYMLTASQADGAVNIGTGQGRSVVSMIESLGRVAGRQPDFRLEPAPVQLPDVIADSQKMRALGWVPEVSFDDGLAQIWHAIGSNAKQ